MLGPVIANFVQVSLQVFGLDPFLRLALIMGTFVHLHNVWSYS
jgi:hypothetical protein